MIKNISPVNVSLCISLMTSDDLLVLCRIIVVAREGLKPVKLYTLLLISDDLLILICMFISCWFTVSVTHGLQQSWKLRGFHL